MEIKLHMIQVRTDNVISTVSLNFLPLVILVVSEYILFSLRKKFNFSEPVSYEIILLKFQSLTYICFKYLFISLRGREVERENKTALSFFGPFPKFLQCLGWAQASAGSQELNPELLSR